MFVRNVGELPDYTALPLPIQHCVNLRLNIVIFRFRFMYVLVLKIFGPKSDEITGDWIELHNEGARNLYSSPNIIKMTKSRSMNG